MSWWILIDYTDCLTWIFLKLICHSVEVLGRRTLCRCTKHQWPKVNHQSCSLLNWSTSFCPQPAYGIHSCSENCELLRFGTARTVTTSTAEKGHSDPHAKRFSSNLRLKSQSRLTLWLHSIAFNGGLAGCSTTHYDTLCMSKRSESLRYLTGLCLVLHLIGTSAAAPCWERSILSNRHSRWQTQKSGSSKSSHDVKMKLSWKGLRKPPNSPKSSRIKSWVPDTSSPSNCTPPAGCKRGCVPVEPAKYQTNKPTTAALQGSQKAWEDVRNLVLNALNNLLLQPSWRILDNTSRSCWPKQCNFPVDSV